MSAGDERVDVDDLPLVVAVDYVAEPTEIHDIEADALVLQPGATPFILFQMKQEGGAVVLDVVASQIPGEDDLIETLEVFFETMLGEREARRMADLGVIVEGETVKRQQPAVFEDGVRLDGGY